MVRNGQTKSLAGARSLSEWNRSESLFSTKPESFRMESFRKESFRIESLRRNLSEKKWFQLESLSEWNLSERIFQKRLFDPTGIFQKESFRMESFRRYLSEFFLTKTGIFQKRIFQKESFRNDFLNLNDSSWVVKSFLKDSF
jgi:hypothetical protein